MSVTTKQGVHLEAAPNRCINLPFFTADVAEVLHTANTIISRNIQAPLGIDHKELFLFFLEKVEILQTPSTPTPFGTKKATAKRKHCSRSSNAPVPKRSTERSGNISQLQPAQDPVMTALQRIQLSISKLDTRIQMLENRPSSSTVTTAITSPSLAPTAPDAAAALTTASASGFAGLLPRRSLAMALPAPTIGAPFFPPAAAISPQMRAQILAVIAGTGIPSQCAPDECVY
ncbi:hypothetical protein DPX16_17758 [Anabarilius grahami]|uniref:Uncharacterized protein n=1 Tax=Anabarilius grahami TaxID=495550 RepID=A0A3N0YHB0_ANAGA|nr:hypothetical protein DPX16_17758 [Anabarilius grahami]